MKKYALTYLYCLEVAVHFFHFNNTVAVELKDSLGGLCFKIYSLESYWIYTLFFMEKSKTKTMVKTRLHK